jgi:hypothetical protein
MEFGAAFLSKTTGVLLYHEHSPDIVQRILSTRSTQRRILSQKRKERPVKFEIRRVCNGAVLRIEPQHPDDEAEEIVYQGSESDEVEPFADFLRCLLDHYGPSTSRYSPKRIHILVEPGDKWEQSAEEPAGG